MLGDPPREALAEGAREERHVDLVIGPHAALEGDRHDPVGRLDEIDPRVVVVDDPVGLLDDRAADLFDRAGLAQAGGCRLEDLELGGPGDGLLEQLGVRQRDRGMRRQGGDERHVAARPAAWLTGHRRQGADDPVVVHQRCGQMAGDIEDALVPLDPVVRIGPDVGKGQDVTGPQDFVDPAFVPVEDRQASGDVVGDAGPRGDLEAVVAQHPDRRRVGAQDALGLAQDHPEQLLAIMRGGQPTGDAKDGVETLGQLGFDARAGEPDPGRGWLRHGRHSIGSGEASEDRTARRRTGSMSRRSGR